MKEIKQHSLKYNFIMNFILSASQVIFPLITFPYISRVLLADGTGKITFATSVANYFLMIASLGIPTYGIRACAQVRNDKEKLSKTVQELLIINFITTFLTIIMYVICVCAVPKFRNEPILFFINGINILLNMIGMNWLYQALEQYDYITFRSVLFKILSVILMLLLVHRRGDYIIYAAITVLAAVGSNVLNLIRARQYVDLKFGKEYDLRQHIKPIFILFAQSLAVSIYTNLDTVMLGFIKSDVDVGYYNAAVKVKNVLVSLVTSLGNVLLPRMSLYAKQHKNSEFLGTMSMAMNFTMLISIPLAFYFSVYSTETISFLAGNGFYGAILPMKIITLSIIPIGLTGILGIQVLTAIEKEKYVLYSVVTGAGVDFILNLLWIPVMGAAGAALSTVLAEFSVLALQIIFLKKMLQEIKENLRTTVYLIFALISTLISYCVKIIDIHSSFLTLIVSVFVFFAVYFSLLLISKDKLFIRITNSLKKK